MAATYANKEPNDLRKLLADGDRDAFAFVVGSGSADVRVERERLNWFVDAYSVRTDMESRTVLDFSGRFALAVQLINLGAMTMNVIGVMIRGNVVLEFTAFPIVLICTSILISEWFPAKYRKFDPVELLMIYAHSDGFAHHRTWWQLRRLARKDPVAKRIEKALRLDHGVG